MSNHSPYPTPVDDQPEPAQARGVAPLEFDDYPVLTDLIHHHTPGFDYLIVLATNIAKFHSAGWRQINNRSPFLIRGEACLLMRKGAPVWGGNPLDCLPFTYIDVAIDRKLGITTATQLEGPRLGDAPTGPGVPVPLPDPREPEGPEEPTADLAPAPAPAPPPRPLAPAPARPILKMPLKGKE